MIDREQMDELIMKNEVKDWWIPKLFEKNTRPLFPAELEIIADPPEESKNHNCFAYALGFADSLELIAETKGFDDVYFLKLLEHDEVQKTETPIDGDYVIYRDLVGYPERLTHIGVIRGDKIVSKWAWGPLVRHDLWDVPAMYGNDVFYVRQISFERSLELYNKYKNELEPLDPK